MQVHHFYGVRVFMYEHWSILWKFTTEDDFLLNAKFVNFGQRNNALFAQVITSS